MKPEAVQTVEELINSDTEDPHESARSVARILSMAWVTLSMSFCVIF